MAGSLNKVLLIGRLGADPEVKQMVNGKSVARLSLATSQTWKDKNTGEKKEKTEWHRIVVFNEGLVNVVQQYLKKGAQIYVEGQLTTRKWKDEQSGQHLVFSFYPEIALHMQTNFQHTFFDLQHKLYQRQERIFLNLKVQL